MAGGVQPGVEGGPRPRLRSRWTNATSTGLILTSSPRTDASAGGTGPSWTRTTWSGRRVWRWTALRKASRTCSSRSPP
ncbi:hypothetical protein ACFQY7_46035 [Actinomadura luteofluorescens]|uniref:hypothetical protein n=1 Tax=Actinomadura luteofluorescens TaxID=46163 RepID=UPI00362C50B1